MGYRNLLQLNLQSHFNIALILLLCGFSQVSNSQSDNSQSELHEIDLSSQAEDRDGVFAKELSSNELSGKNIEASKEAEDDKCVVEFESDEWIDRMRSKTHHRVCRSVLWVDSLFGDEHEFNDENFRGKISLGFRGDEADGFDPKLRVRIRTKLPNVSNRFNAFIGRVEEDSYVSNTEVDDGSISEVGLRSTNDDEDEWLIGLGYRNPRKDNNGFDFSLDGVFRNILEVEEFVEVLEMNFELLDKTIYHIIETVAEET
ncbi:MAG: hypothetical protein KTR16_15100, partial [Acidiferrobacterales bacterium]|nr:hypothetical protein [Acidiferrobacterales bacterium]